jgi:eukaryotic-like serine/threonine-protein kinase
VLMARSYEPSASTRRRTFIAQLVAEVAARCGDIDACNALIAHAAGEGLFDLHWLDRCPMLEPARRSAAFVALRAQVKQRADAILDALYGDHVVAVTDTTVASSIAD